MDDIICIRKNDQGFLFIYELTETIAGRKYQRELERIINSVTDNKGFWTEAKPINLNALIVRLAEGGQCQNVNLAARRSYL
jgi:hypothetical protein